MVIIKTKDGEMACQQLPNDCHPHFGVLSPIDDQAVPCVGDRLDGLAVTEPANIRKVRRHDIMLMDELLDGGHPWVIGEGKGHPVGAEKVEQSRRDPPTITDLDREAGPGR